MTSTNVFRPAVALDADCMARIGTNKHAIMGIRFAEGDPANPPAATPPAATPPAATPPAESTPPAETAPAINKATGKPYTPAETATYIAGLREEAKNNRETAASAKTAQDAAEAKTAAVLAALGLNPDGTASNKTPEELTAALEERDKDVEGTKRENLLLRVAGKSSVQANADKLLDSRSFMTKLSALKSDDKDGVETLVKEWIENDPSYKVTSAAASSGGTTHTGTTPPTGRKNMADAVAARMAPGSK